MDKVERFLHFVTGGEEMKRRRTPSTNHEEASRGQWETRGGHGALKREEEILFPKRGGDQVAEELPSDKPSGKGSAHTGPPKGMM